MTTRYARDPYWLDRVRYPATCAKPGCTQEIARGDRAFYYPRGRALYAVPCGHADAAARDFAACAEDERMGGAW